MIAFLLFLCFIVLVDIASELRQIKSRLKNARVN